MKVAFAGSLIAVLCLASPGLGEEDKGGPGGGRPAKLLEMFDVDGDGELNGEEREAAKRVLAERRAERAEEGDRPRGRPSREEIMARFDEDGDGELNAAERRAVWAAARRARHAAGKGGRRQLSPEMKRRLLERFDSDGDGELNNNERAAARRFRQENFQRLREANADGAGNQADRHRGGAERAPGDRGPRIRPDGRPPGAGKARRGQARDGGRPPGGGKARGGAGGRK